MYGILCTGKHINPLSAVPAIALGWYPGGTRLVACSPRLSACRSRCPAFPDASSTCIDCIVSYGTLNLDPLSIFSLSRSPKPSSHSFVCRQSLAFYHFNKQRILVRNIGVREEKAHFERILGYSLSNAKDAHHEVFLNPPTLTSHTCGLVALRSDSPSSRAVHRLHILQAISRNHFTSMVWQTKIGRTFPPS